KVMCRDYQSAKRILCAVQDWLKIRLKLDISEEKSKIVHLRKNYSEFLGVKIKAVKKGKTFGGYVAKSHISDKALERMKREIKEQVKTISNNVQSSHVTKLNSMILGWHEYYSCATYCNIDFAKLDFSLKPYMHHKLRQVGKFLKPSDTDTS